MLPQRSRTTLIRQIGFPHHLPGAKDKKDVSNEREEGRMDGWMEGWKDGKARKGQERPGKDRQRDTYSRFSTEVDCHYGFMDTWMDEKSFSEA